MIKKIALSILPLLLTFTFAGCGIACSDADEPVSGQGADQEMNQNA